MADIELVIKIPEDMYKNALNDLLCGSETLVNAIKNGTPLPKGHGRIYTEKDMRSFLKCEEYDTCIWKNCSECNKTKCITEDNLYKVNAIIEADKEVKAYEDKCKEDKHTEILTYFDGIVLPYLRHN